MQSDSEFSDDAPDDISFQQSKQITSKIKLNQTAGERNIRKDRKHKNKQREELFKEQKKAKLAKLTAVTDRLPDEVLDALPDEEEALKEEDITQAPPLATHTEFSSDDELDDGDSGINSNSAITSKISVKEVEGIKARTFSSALSFKAVKDSGCNANIKRQSAKESQLIREKRRVNRRR